MAWKDIPEKKVLATLKDGKSFKGVAAEKMTIYVDGGVPGGEGDVQGISVTVDPNTYVMTTQLKDGTGGNVGSPATVDLPLESMVVGGEYDDTTKKVILTLKNGETVEFSVADLVAGLQSEITPQNPLSADLVAETTNKNFVTSEEKEDISNISGLADDVETLNTNVEGLQSDVSGLNDDVDSLESDLANKQDTIDSNNPLNADYIDDENSNKKLVSSDIASELETLFESDTPPAGITTDSDGQTYANSEIHSADYNNILNVSIRRIDDFYNEAAISIYKEGLGQEITFKDHPELRNLDDFLGIYQTIASIEAPAGIYNLTSTYAGGGVCLDSNYNIHYSLDTKEALGIYTIAYADDEQVGLVQIISHTTAEGIRVWVVDNGSRTLLKEYITGSGVTTGSDVPPNFTDGTTQVYQKGQLYGDTTNGVVYVCTASRQVGNRWQYTWKSVVLNGQNVSTLVNDAGYQNASQVSSAIASAVGQITSFEYQVVSTLPQTGEAGVIYLLANSGTTPNIYDEYIWVNNAFEKIGTTDIDLSGYATTQDLEDGLAGKADAIDPADLPSGSTQNGVITTSDHTDIDPAVVDEGQIVVDSTDGKVYIVSEITTDPQTGDPVIVWKEVQTDKEVVYANMTVTDVQAMTFVVNDYTATEIHNMLNAGMSVFYRLTLPQAVGGLAAGVYDFRPIYHTNGAVMSSLSGPAGNNSLLGIAYHTDVGTPYIEMRFLQNQIDSNNKLSADLIDSSSSDEKTYQTGTGAPTTSSEGSVGEIYVDKSTGKVYVCTSTTGGTYTWTEVSGTQVQVDWGQSDSTAVDFIKNKPTIPTVGDGVLTIKRNGAQIISFHANATSNSSVNIEVPEITMTTTDPGEGASLAANNFIAVYEA